jgi:hypothetical protein
MCGGSSSSSSSFLIINDFLIKDPRYIEILKDFKIFGNLNDYHSPMSGCIGCF